jgi:tetratricopeptide (TPR) repeat protein
LKYEDEVETALEACENLIQKAQNSFPNEGEIWNLDAKLSEILGDTEFAGNSLQIAYNKNPRNISLIQRYATWLVKEHKFREAQTILENAMKIFPDNKLLFFRLAKILHETRLDASKALYYFSRSYQSTDRNYEARFWHARYAYEYGNDQQKNLAISIFAELRELKALRSERIRLRDFSMRDDDSHKRYTGRIQSMDFNLVKIRQDITSDEVVLYRSSVDDEIWSQFALQKRVDYAIGFAYVGAVAFDLTVIPF